MTDSALHLDTRSTASMADDAPSGSLLPGEWAGLSDAGRSRAHNEDAWRIDPAIGLIVLADGMGGYNAGEVASAIAVETVVRALTDEIFGPARACRARGQCRDPGGRGPAPLMHGHGDDAGGGVDLRQRAALLACRRLANLPVACRAPVPADP